MKRQQRNNIAIFPMTVVHLTFTNGTENIRFDELMLMLALLADWVCVSANVVGALLV
jgi:hypothetical protein